MFTDLHCHILFGVDDGPARAPESVAVAKLLVSLGFGRVVATPHALPQFANALLAGQRRDELAELLGREKVALQIELGAENRLDEQFMAAELASQGRHLGGSRYTLVEAPYETVVPALPDLLFRLSRKGVVPVLAHPERCAEFQQPERAAEAVRLGAVLQLDVGSLVGVYGRQPRKTALKLLEAGLYGVAATDVHEAEEAGRWLPQALEELERRASAAGLARLLDENPGRVLRGEELS